ncbi:hypothetical protein C8Q74DRAFT_151496 [Fomes fomentarius]|nr:hypothetical protein C8Q74DRAFT_151496 [Fomes fomentarius]
MADMLPVNDHDALSVPPELISATTTRALRAIASVIDTLVSSCGDKAPRTNGLLITSTNSNSNLKARDPATIVDALNASLRRLVSVSVPALLAYDRVHTASTTTTKRPESRKKQKSAVGLPEPSGAAARAVDDLLGILYTLVLAPALRSFSPLSEGFVEACLGVDSASGPRFGPRSPPGAAQNGSTTTSATISPSGLTHPADLRPSILALVDDALCVLEQVLPATNGSSGTSSDASPSAFAPASSGSHTASGLGTRSQTQRSCSVFKNAGPDSHAHYQAEVGAGAEAIPSACHVKTLLALECVRELEKLYLPPRMTINPLDAPTEPEARIAGVPDALSGKGDVVPEAERRNTTRDGRSACGLQETITQSAVASPHSLPRRFPGLAEVLCQTLGDDSTRPGTVSGSASSSSPSPAASRTSLRLDFAGEPHRAPRSPRVAGNLGEIAAAGSTGSGPGCGPVRDSVRRATAVAEGRRRPGAAGASDTHAHAHAGVGDLRERTQQREKIRARTMVTTRLARKDTVWYLCAVLQRVLPAVALPSGSGCRSHCDAASGGCGSGLDCDAASASACPAATATATATTAATLAGNTASPSSAPNTPQAAIDTGPGTHTNTDTDTRTAIERAAEQAVYDALADLLRRTRRTLPIRTRALLASASSGFHPRKPSPGSGSGEASNHGRPAPASTSSFAFAAEDRASDAVVLSEGLLVPAATGSGEFTSTSTGAETGTGTGTGTEAGVSGGSAEIGVPRDRRGHMRAGTRSAGKGPALQAERERAREGQEAMGEVERGMLLAVLERTWLSIGVC